MHEATIQFPVTCPECQREALLTRPQAAVAAALVNGNTRLELYAPCHARHWRASPHELLQIREYLGAWLTAAISASGASKQTRSISSPS